LFRSKNAEKDEKEIFKMYYEYDEAIRSLVSHRTLAINRGEKEDVLRVKVVAPEEKIMQFLQKKVIGKVQSEDCAKLIEAAMEDSYKRLIEPSVEREIRARLTETAESQAINGFTENLRNLLLQPPLKVRVILSVDPAFRSGCKLAVVHDTDHMVEEGVMVATAPRIYVMDAVRMVLK